MKKVSLFILVLFLFMTIKAAEPIRWGVVAGANVTDVKGDLSNRTRLGFHVGAKGEIYLTNSLFLDSRLLFSLKPYKSDNFFIKENNESKSLVTNTTNYYMELPIHIGYKVNVTDNFSFLFSGGGYVGLGLFGRYTTKYNGQKSSESLYKSSNKHNRFDCGVGARIGAEFMKKVQVSASYDFGLTNIKRDTYNGAKHRNLMASCAYLF